MTRLFSSVLTPFWLRHVSSLAVIIFILRCGMTCMAQHAGHFHSPGFGGVSNNFGGSGGFNASAPLGGFNANAPLGGVSFGNGFGTATYSSGNYGVTTYGVSRRGFGCFNHGVAYGYPVIWSTPIYSYSPSVFGYGSGIFSPNFPSGNYISNGYIGFVPSGVYNVAGYSGWPYATCLNPYFGGVAIAPNVLMLNINVNMQPVMQPTASYAQIDPRMIDILAPAVDPNAFNRNRVGVPPIPQPPEPDNQPVFPDAPQLPVQTDGVPVLNEFNALPREQIISSLAEKIQSLRYQASGDDAFHKSDYATADVFYATAIKTAPDRRAPYLRMAMVQIALKDFADATSYLKAGLTMESDASRPWCTLEELYGQKAVERARLHSGPLWNWLAESPLSADRMLLAGTFQKLRGYNKTADEMLALASHAGPEATLVSEVMQLAASDVGSRAIAEDLEQLVEHASAKNETSIPPPREPAGKSAVEKSGGIFLRGRDVAVRTRVSATSQPLVMPAPVAADESPAPFEIPLPEQN